MELAELILLLSDVPGIGEKTLGAVLRRNAALGRGPEEFLACAPEEMTAEYGLRRESARRVKSIGPEALRRAQLQARDLRMRGVLVLTEADSLYPRRLVESLEDPPPVLYAYGCLELLARPLFCVAQSNGACDAALAAADAACCAAVEQGWSPVTGHNRPPYQRAALAAQRNGARVCYVLDRGLLEAFDGDLTRQPFAAAHIWSPDYDPRRDLTISSLPLRAHGLATHNRERDRLLFALASAVLAGEVRAGGQMHARCREALSRGTPVLLVAPPYLPDLLEAGARPASPSDLRFLLQRDA